MTLHIKLILIIVLPIIVLPIYLCSPLMKARRELTASVGEDAETSTVADMEKVASRVAEKHDIHDRVVALTKAWPSKQRVLIVRVQAKLFGSSKPATVMLVSNCGNDVRVRICGNVVYEQVGENIRTYLGMGEWEYLLGDIEKNIATDREEYFRVQREKRFGPLQGWKLGDQ